MKVILAFVACISLVAATAPLLNIGLTTTIPDQYMVVFHMNSSVEIRNLHVAELVARFAAHEKIINVFDIGNLIGYSAVLSKDTLAKELEHPNVRYIEADQVVSINADLATVQENPTWGIDRIDQRDLPLDKKYNYWTSAGDGVTAYVIDTGILLTHNEFEGRAKAGTNTVPGENDVDGNGHGTHVAGTIGGKTFGVAKKVTLVAVKVLGASGSGTWSGVIAGIDWVTKDHTEKKGRSVANMSLGGGVSDTVDTAVIKSVAAGVTYVIAAGNYADDTCYYSPARVESALTVGATTNTDARSSFSNIGRCVDIFAPGTGITSAWISSNTATNTISGTSMAAPHVAGAAAAYIGHILANTPEGKVPSGITPTDVDRALKDTATQGVVTDPGTGSPNLFLYSSFSDV